MATHLSRGPAETEAIGERLAAELRPGDVVMVRGELGAGKTTLIRGACRALGVSEQVTSPTFTIGHCYRGPVPVSHVDLYRLGPQGLAGEEPGLLDDYLGPQVICFVEWPELAAEALGRVSRRVAISHAGGDCRRLVID